MYPVLIELGNFKIYSYGVFNALAFLFAFIWIYKNASKYDIDLDHIFSLSLLVITFSIIGARLFYVIQFFNEFQGNLWQIFNLRGGGQVFYGGLFGGLLALFSYTKIKKLPFLKLLDLITPGLILGYAIGRIGCFLNGCCYGKETDVFCAVHFTTIYGLRHPTQIYATIINFFSFLYLAFLAKRQKYTGQIFISVAFLYVLYRFLIEFIRENPLYFYLSIAQWISLVFFFILIWLYNNKKKL